ncbi:MAG: RsiV family protein [Lachnospiraceae bacterium]
MMKEKGFKTIDETTNFYLNKDGDVVIVFEKYQYTPGYMGTPEFIIKRI